MVVDRAAFPRDKCCGDGLTTGALRELEALGLRPVGGAVVAGRGRRVRALAIRAAGALSPPAWPGPVRRGRAARRPRRCIPRRGPRRGREGARRPRARPAPSTAATTSSSRSTASAAVRPLRDRRRRHVVAVAQGPRPAAGPATSASGMRSASTSAEVSPPRRDRCGCGSSPTCCRATRGRSRCPAAAPTWASASSAASGVPTSSMNDLWPELLAAPAAARRARRRRPSRGHRTRPGPSPPRVDDAVLAAGRALFVGDAAGGHRPDDGRGHRPGAPHRPPRRATRSRSPSRERPERVRSRYAARRTSSARRRPPHVDAAHPGPAPCAGAARGAVRVAGLTTGPGATSPAGCWRTSRAPSRSRRTAGTARS